MVFLPGSDYGYTVLPRDTKVVREAGGEEKEGGTPGSSVHHCPQACPGCLSCDETSGRIQGGAFVSILQGICRREGGDTLRIGGRFRWSLARLGAVFPVEREYIGRCRGHALLQFLNCPCRYLLDNWGSVRPLYS